MIFDVDVAAVAVLAVFDERDADCPSNGGERTEGYDERKGDACHWTKTGPWKSAVERGTVGPRRGWSGKLEKRKRRGEVGNWRTHARRADEKDMVGMIRKRRSTVFHLVFEITTHAKYETTQEQSVFARVARKS